MVSYQEALNSLSRNDDSMDEAFFFIGDEPKRVSTLESVIGDMLSIPSEAKNGFYLETVDGNYVTILNAAWVDYLPIQYQKAAKKYQLWVESVAKGVGIQHKNIVIEDLKMGVITAKIDLRSTYLEAFKRLNYLN